MFQLSSVDTQATGLLQPYTPYSIGAVHFRGIGRLGTQSSTRHWKIKTLRNRGPLWRTPLKMAAWSCLRTEGYSLQLWSRCSRTDQVRSSSNKRGPWKLILQKFHRTREAGYVDHEHQGNVDETQNNRIPDLGFVCFFTMNPDSFHEQLSCSCESPTLNARIEINRLDTLGILHSPGEDAF